MIFIANKNLKGDKSNMKNLLKELREGNGVSQIKLSIASNITQSRLSSLESGHFKPTEKEALKLIKGWFLLGQELGQDFDFEKEILEITSSGHEIK